MSRVKGGRGPGLVEEYREGLRWSIEGLLSVPGLLSRTERDLLAKARDIDIPT